MGKINAGELVADREIVQLFRTAGGELAFISPVFATYARQNAGSVILSLHRVPEALAANPPPPPVQSPNKWKRRFAAVRALLNLTRRPAVCGEQIAALTLPCAALIDCDAVNFPIGPAITKPGELLALRIRTDRALHGSSPTVWLINEEDRIPGHIACYIGGISQGAFGIQASLTYGGEIAETSVPRMLLYSPVTQCNLNCIHCISAETRTKASKLPASFKEKMLEWSSAGKLETISSDYSGDILWADARFGGELDFITSLGIPFHIDTNGVYLTAEVSARLCQMLVGSLNISLDAARPETYKRIRKGSLPLSEVVANIAELMSARKEAGVNFPVSISFTIMRSNLEEWPEFVRMGKELGVDIVIARHLEAFTPEMEEESLWHDQTAFNAMRLEIEALSQSLGIVATIPSPFSGTAQTGRNLCTVPWTSAVLLGNGDVAACCVPGTVMGNLNENTMEEIWNGPRYRELRTTVNSSKPSPVCAACPMFRKTDNPDSYLIHSALKRLTTEQTA
jgi:MoaA/NifB/PqqE/SkfB family radical SAM enzyme